MTCYTIKSRRMTLGDAKRDAGESLNWLVRPGMSPLQIAEAKVDCERICRGLVSEVGERPMFVHGDAGPPCQCGSISTVLCDYPMGEGKTCDAPLCEQCSRNVGEDRDLCALHFTHWRATPLLRSLPLP